MYRLEDLQFMEEALRLARAGTGLASPNPRVGAVVARAGQVVGRGVHRYAEMDHAEALALAEAGERAEGATLYLNLEPCCHTGRTPPCVEAVIRSRVARVVAAIADPNPRVAGEGFRQLEAAGIRVETGCLANEARRLNEDFAKLIRTGLPFVTLKAAVSLDGRIAAAGEVGRIAAGGKAAADAAAAPAERRLRNWISSAASRERVQEMRHERDAILVGIGTVEADDPLLTDRTKRLRRRPLLRVVLDSRLRIGLETNLVKTARRGKDVAVFCAEAEAGKRAALEKAGVRVCAVGGDGGVDLEAVLRQLGGEQISSVLLEGGARVNGAMLSGGWVDKLVLFQAPLLLGDGGVPLAAGLALPPGRGISGKPTTESVGTDLMIEAYLEI